MSTYDKLDTINDSLNNIKSAVIAKGSTPTGDITTYATAISNILSGAPKYGLTVSNFIGDVDSNGALEPPTAISGMTFTGVTKTTSTLVNEEHIPALSLSNSNIAGTISFPDLTTIEAYSLYTSFRDNKITSISMPNLTTVGDYGMYECFYSTYQNTRTISGTIDLSNLTTVGDYGMSSAFTNQPEITGVSLANLTTVGNHGMSSAFSYCTGLTNIDLSSLTTIDAYGLTNTFDHSKLTNITFDNLSSIGANGLQNAFSMNSTLQSISFPALTPNSFASGNTSAFFNMLSVVSNATVHFPVDLENVIGSWSDVLNGFGGTNTTVLFDLNGCETTFDITPARFSMVKMINSDTVYASGDPILLRKGTTLGYVIYNKDYGLYVNSYNVPTTDTAIATIDLRYKTYNTLTFDVGIIGLKVICKVNGCQSVLNDAGDGTYTLKICNDSGSNVDVMYHVDGGDYYTDADGTVAFGTSDASVQINLTPATSVQFIRPNLTENGTMGGDAFAVTCSGYNSSYAYEAVDNSSYDGVQVNYSNGICRYEFYNPIALKVSQLDFIFNSTYRAATDIDIKGSNDNITWESLDNWSGEASTNVSCEIGIPKAYKYYRLDFIPAGSSTFVQINDIAITATYKQL